MEGLRRKVLGKTNGLQRVAVCCEATTVLAELIPEHPERAAAAVTGFKRIDSDQ